MKKIVWGILLGIGLVAYVMAGSITEKVTWTDTFAYLKGDSTVTDTVDTFFTEFSYDMSAYRVTKLFYQPDVTFGGMSSCSAWVDVQTGTGSEEGYWRTLTTFIITGDSLYSTSGWDLRYTVVVDSVDRYLRFVSRIQTQDSDSGASDGEKVKGDSTYTISHTLEILARE